MSKPNKVPEKELGKCPPETEVFLQCLLDLAPVINTAKLLKKMNRNLKIRGDELIPISEGVQLNGIWVKEAISQIKEPDKSNAGLQKCSVPTQVGKSPTGNANLIHEIRYNNVVPKAIYSLEYWLTIHSINLETQDTSIHKQHLLA